MGWNRVQSAKGTAAATTVTATYGTNLSTGSKLIAVAVTSSTTALTGVASRRDHIHGAGIARERRQ